MMLKVEEKLCCLSICLQAFSLSCICLSVCTVLYRLQRQMFVREEYFALEQVEGSSFYCSSPPKQPSTVTCSAPFIDWNFRPVLSYILMNITEFQHKFYVTTQQPWCEEKMVCAKFKALVTWFFFFFGGEVAVHFLVWNRYVMKLINKFWSCRRQLIWAVIFLSELLSAVSL